MELIFLAGLVALIYFSYQYFKTKKKLSNPIMLMRSLYSELKTEEEYNKMSIFVLAERMGCLPDQAKFFYFKELEHGEFNYDMLIETEKKFRQQKFNEGHDFKISYQNTPSAILERWTMEYRNNNLQIKRI
jgi:hypothetical protein